MKQIKLQNRLETQGWVEVPISDSPEDRKLKEKFFNLIPSAKEVTMRDLYNSHVNPVPCARSVYAKF